MNVKQIFTHSIFTLIFIVISGCYETETPIFSKGEKTSMVGKYECTSKLDGSKKFYTFTEHKEGFLFLAKYKYVDQRGTSTLLKKLPSGLYLAQLEKEKGGAQYAFVDFLDDKNYLILVADLMSKGSYIEPLLKKFKVEGKNVHESLMLKGNKDAILSFMAAHDKSMMMVILNCTKWGG